MSGHTPTPWKQEGLCIDAQDDTIVAACYFDHCTSKRAKANAEFIVKAVNIHEALVACVKELLGVYWADGDGQYPEPACIENARAALKACGEN